jgi:hypothetical protein
LLKLGIPATKRTIQKHMREVRPPGKRGHTCSTFIRNHSPEVWACDFLQHYDALFRPIFAFFVVVHGTREVVHFNVTRHPNRDWLRETAADGESSQDDHATAELKLDVPRLGTRRRDRRQLDEGYSPPAVPCQIVCLELALPVAK